MKRIIFFMVIIITIPAIGQKKNLTPETLWKLGRISDIQISPDEKTILFGITYYDLIENKGNRDLYTMSVNGGIPSKVTDFPGTEFNGIWRPDGKKIAFLSSKSGSVQIWEMNTDGSNKKQISDIEGGVNGFSYAPTLDKILFIKDIKLDSTVNDVYPDLPKADGRVITDLMYRHWDSWHDFSYSHIFYATYNLSDSKIGKAYDILENLKYDSPLTPDGGMEQIAWSPDGKHIAYTCKELTGIDYALSTNSDIYLYNVETKQKSNISKGLEGYDMDPVFSPDGNKIVWSSMEKAGFESDKKRIMLYDIPSKHIKDLSANFDQSSSDFKWDKSGENVFFISGIEATYQIYAVNIGTGKISSISKGIHNYTNIVLQGQNVIGTKMSMSMPTEIFKLTKTKTEYSESQLTFINKAILDTIEMGKVEKRWITTTDNKKMLVWVIYPPNFDKTKKYPALLYCQGGPQSAVSQSFSYRWNFQIMAANDYIIIAPNRRGLPTFGQEWNDQISQDYGGQNMKDYLSAIDSVSKEQYINKDRLGAVGASYGGYSVYWLAGNHNKRFKAFIAHCGMFNFESWYGSTEEFWFANHDLGGPYWQIPKPKSYDSSPHKFVNNWDTPIMVIEGGNDFRIPYTQGIEAFNTAQLLGIPSKFLYFPEETHFVTKPQNSILWQREFFKWIDTYLKK